MQVRRLPMPQYLYHIDPVFPCLPFHMTKPRHALKDYFGIVPLETKGPSINDVTHGGGGTCRTICRLTMCDEDGVVLVQTGEWEVKKIKLFYLRNAKKVRTGESDLA